MQFIKKIFRRIARFTLPEVVVVGIDIQEQHVSFVARARQGDRSTDVVSGEEALPDGTIADGVLKNDHALYNTLQKLFQSVPIVKMRQEPVVVLSIPPLHMYSEIALFPRMNEKDLAEAIRLKMETSLPWPLEKSYYDWKVRDIGDDRQVAVFIAGVSKEYLDPYLSVFRQGNWRVAACEFHLLSLAHTHTIRDVEQDQLFVLLDEDGAEFAVFRKGAILTHFVKKLDSGAKDAENSREMLRTKIVFETKRIIAYVETELNLKLQHVSLFDRAGMEAEVEQLQKELDLPVESFAPDRDPSYYVALGAASRDFENPERATNLLPTGSGGRYNEYIILRSLALWRTLVALFLAVATITTLAFYMFLQTQLQILEETASNMKDVFNQQISRSSELLEFAKDFNALTAEGVKAGDNASHVGVAMQSIEAALATGNIRVEKFDKLVGKREIKATIVAPTRESLLAFKEELEEAVVETDAGDEVALFDDIDLPVLQLAQEENVRVDITINYIAL